MFRYSRLAVLLTVALSTIAVEPCQASQAWHACQSAGTHASDQGDLSKARTLFLAALREAEIIGDRDLIAQSATDLSAVLSMSSRQDEARRLLKDLSVLCENDSSVTHKSKAAIHATLSRLEKSAGNDSDAAVEASRALDHLDRDRDAEQETVEMLTHLAILKLSTSEADAAEAMACRAADIAKYSEHVTERSKAEALSALALAQLAAGRLDDANSSADKAASVADAHPHAMHHRIHTLRGMIQLAEGNPNLAESHFADAHTILKNEIYPNEKEISNHIGWIERARLKNGNSNTSPTETNPH